MEENKLTQEMKRQAVIVAIHAETAILKHQFFNVACSFVHKVCWELEASDGNMESVAKRTKHKPHSDIVRALKFVQQVQNIMMKTLQTP